MPTSRPLVFVDDDEMILDVYGQLLVHHLSCPVHCFSRPADALAQLPALNPAVILTDYSMPDINGLQFLLRAQPLLTKTNFLILTGDSIMFSEADFRQLPTLKDVLRKPLQCKEVARHILAHWPDLPVPSLT